MLESISDSDEDVLLSPGCVNKRRLTHKISLLPTTARRQLQQHHDFDKYSSILSSEVIQGALSDDSDVSASSQESVLDLINLPSRHLVPEPHKSTNTPANIAFATQKTRQQQEDAENLQIFLDANVQNLYSRRGLRKRNFASTYPYLNDKAQYLGLSDSARLNYLYEENHDVEGIIRMLNKAYLQRKKKYPHEDRFKARTFYSFLGVGSKVNKKEDFSDSLEKQDVDSQVPYTNYNNDDADSENEEEIGGYALEGSLDFLQRTTSTIIEETDDIFDLPPNRTDSFTDERNIFDFDSKSAPPRDFPSDTDSLSSDEEMVRVGGKLRREKSILHGALPESTKRLESYKPSKRKYSKRPSKLDYRKGLAIKKPKSHHLNPLHDEMKDFVDEEVYYRDPSEQFISSGTPPPDHMNIGEATAEKMPSMDSDGYLVFDVHSNSSDEFSEHEQVSERYNKSTEFYRTQRETIESFNSPKESIDFRNFPTETIDLSDGYESVIESDRINPLFTAKPKSGNSFKKSERKHSPSYRKSVKKQSSLQYPSTISSTNSNGRRAQTSTPKRLGYPRKRGGLSLYGKLQKKKMITPKKQANKSIPTSELKSNLYHKRDPLPFTTAFETESRTKFVKQISANSSRSALKNLSLRRREKDTFPSDSILGGVDINKIAKMKDGQLFQNLGDSVVITLLGIRYSFFLFDKSNSQDNFERLLLHIRKILLDTKYSSDQSVLSEVYNAIKGIIEWCLIIQEYPSDKAVRILQSILNGAFKTEEKTKLYMISFLILLDFVFIQLHQKYNPSKNNDVKQLEKYSCSYWINIFRNFGLDDMNSIFHKEDIKGLESINCMIMLQQKVYKSWWTPINESVQVVDSFKAEKAEVLSILYVISTMSPMKSPENWTCFYNWYTRFQNDESSQTHNNFLDIIYLLHHQLDWQLQERMVLSFYSILTKRKFANFMDESQVPELIGHITSRLDFPEKCFFDRFMEFLYYYISSLPVSYNKKRLITKLTTSSQYHYEKNKKHYAMFINRMNIILLLSQVSESDLNDQVYNLIFQIRDCNDIKIYEQALAGLDYYSQTIKRRNESIQKNLEGSDNIVTTITKRVSFPINSYVVMIEIANKHYHHIPGIVTIWRKFARLMNLVTGNENNAQFFELMKHLELVNFADELSSTVIGFTLNCVNAVISSKLTLNQEHVLTLLGIEEKIISYLSFQMGKFPISDEHNKNRVTNLIEQCIRLWVRITFLTPKSNWNAILFQRFPYIGNNCLRMEFILFLYLDLSHFVSLDGYSDNIIRIIFTVAASTQRSKYLFMLLNELSKSNLKIYSLKNLYTLELLNDTQYLSLKATVLSSIIVNIKNDRRIPEMTKMSYFKDLLSTMDTEFNVVFNHAYYVDFYKRIMDVLRKNCKEELNSLDNFKSLSNKLGFQSNDKELTWKSLHTKDKLSHVHKRLIECLHFGLNLQKTFKECMLVGNWEVLYNLLYIYVKAISSLQDDKWYLSQLLLAYFSEQLRLGKVNVSEKSFLQFISFLKVLPYLKARRWNQSLYQSCQYRVIRLSLDILRTTYYIFDGYRDISDVKDIIFEFLNLCDSDPNLENDLTDISLYSLFDIQSSHALSYTPEISDDDINILEQETEGSRQSLLRLVKGEKCVDILLFELDLFEIP